MSKNTHLVIYTIVFICLFILFFLEIRNSPSEEIKNENRQPKIETKNQELGKARNILIQNKNDTSSSLKIAFVNSDTVSKYYLYAQKVQSNLIAKRASAENQIKNKYKSYEDLVKEFEKASPIMGEREKLEKAQNIRLLEQEILKVEQELSSELANEEVKMTQQYVKKTDEFMQKIGESIGYDYVLSYRIGGPMLFANPKLDITSEIISLLNENYQINN